MSEYSGIKEKFTVNGIKDGWTDFDGEIEKFPETVQRIPTKKDEFILAFFSSGTTGYPKLVFHAHDYPAAHIFTAKHWHNLTDTSLHLTIAETGWAKSMWGKMYGQFTVGAAVFVYDFDRFSADEVLRCIEKYKITSLCCPPTMYRLFIKEGMGGYDLSSLEYATTAGEALNPEVFNRFYDFTGLKIMEAFGQTESTVITVNVRGTVPRPGSMGKPNLLYSVDIVDAGGNPVSAGETGEVVIRTAGGHTDGLFKGYSNGRETTVPYDPSGVYRTGDTAYRDEDGYYWYVGRIDDLIKSSGYRIGPFEIESVLVEHPAVLEAAVTGVPDPVRGQIVKATVVLTKDYTDADRESLVKELQNHVKTQTAPYKYPRIIEFVAELPKTISGKIRRVEIREKDSEQLK
jgi:acetyl-CoA synthetase